MRVRLGYRLAWSCWYDRLPSSLIDQRCLEAELQSALLQGDGQEYALDHAGTIERAGTGIEPRRELAVAAAGLSE